MVQNSSQFTKRSRMVLDCSNGQKLFKFSKGYGTGQIFKVMVNGKNDLNSLKIVKIIKD